jgi:hypothetical protein
VVVAIEPSHLGPGVGVVCIMHPAQDDVPYVSAWITTVFIIIAPIESSGDVLMLLHHLKSITTIRGRL